MTDRECEVYWGSHGCELPRGHHQTDGPDRYCRCDCVDPGDTGDGAYPYFGPETMFYGRDIAEVWGLPDEDSDDTTRTLAQSPRYEAQP